MDYYSKRPALGSIQGARGWKHWAGAGGGGSRDEESSASLNILRFRDIGHCPHTVPRRCRETGRNQSQVGGEWNVSRI